MDRNNGSDLSMNSSTSTIVDSPAATAAAALILSLVFVLGVPGNLFIIWSVLARARKQSVTTLLILNLAFADGSLMALTPFFIIYLLLKKWVFGNVLCKILYYLCLANMYASIHLIMLMSLYRLVAVLWPQRVVAITRRRTVLRVLAVAWVVVIVASVPAVIFRREKKMDDRLVCVSSHDNDSQVSDPIILSFAQKGLLDGFVSNVPFQKLLLFLCMWQAMPPMLQKATLVSLELKLKSVSR